MLELYHTSPIYELSRTIYSIYLLWTTSWNSLLTARQTDRRTDRLTWGHIELLLQLKIYQFYQMFFFINEGNQVPLIFYTFVKVKICSEHLFRILGWNIFFQSMSFYQKQRIVRFERMKKKFCSVILNFI